MLIESGNFLARKMVLKEAQLARDGTYPRVENFYWKNLLNQNRAKNDKTKKNDEGLKMSNTPQKGSV